MHTETLEQRVKNAVSDAATNKDRVIYSHKYTPEQIQFYDIGLVLYATLYKKMSNKTTDEDFSKQFLNHYSNEYADAVCAAFMSGIHNLMKTYNVDVRTMHTNYKSTLHTRNKSTPLPVEFSRQAGEIISKYLTAILFHALEPVILKDDVHYHESIAASKALHKGILDSMNIIKKYGSNPEITSVARDAYLHAKKHMQQMVHSGRKKRKR